MLGRAARTGGAIALSSLGLLSMAFGAPPAAAQVVVVEETARTVDSSGEYDFTGLMLGFSGVVLTAANASVIPAGGPGMGVIGIGVGAVQIAYGADGLGDDQASDFIAGFNVGVGVLGILAGLRQIRGTRVGPAAVDAEDDPQTALRARFLPGPDGPGILLSWSW